MNFSFVAISTLIKSNIGEQCLINILMNISTQSLRDYLKCYFKFGCITDKLNKEGVRDISTKQANQILNKSNIVVKSLPGYGNAELKREDIKWNIKEKPFIKV